MNCKINEKYLTMKTQNTPKIIVVIVAIIMNCFSAKVNAQEAGTEILSDHILNGIQYEQLENYNGAIKEYSIAIQNGENLAIAYDKRGVVYTKINKYIRAINDFYSSLELNSNLSETFNHLGIVYYLLEEYDLAIASYDKALNIDPNYAKVYFNRGIVRLKLDDEIGATSDMSKASELRLKSASDFLSQNNIKSQSFGM